MNTTKAWYIRRQSNRDIKGPFPSGQISQEILLGRYQLDDEVSHDKAEWLRLGDIAELLPDILKEDQNEPGFNERLAAARRWADERRGVAEIDVDDKRRSSSSYESEEIKRLHRLATEAKKKSSPFSIFLQFSIMLLVVITTIVLAFQYSPKDKSVIDCEASASQGVDWSNCNLSGAQLLKSKLIAANLMNTNLQTANLSGADLSYANLQYAQLHLAHLKNTNLTKANLKGANLMGADLSEALFIQADMSYANLRDSIILNTDFSNARLDHAIWIDGRTCRVNSLGSCN